MSKTRLKEAFPEFLLEEWKYCENDTDLITHSVLIKSDKLETYLSFCKFNKIKLDASSIWSSVFEYRNVEAYNIVSNFISKKDVTISCPSWEWSEESSSELLIKMMTEFDDFKKIGGLYHALRNLNDEHLYRAALQIDGITMASLVDRCFGVDGLYFPDCLKTLRAMPEAENLDKKTRKAMFQLAVDCLYRSYGAAVNEVLSFPGLKIAKECDQNALLHKAMTGVYSNVTDTSTFRLLVKMPKFDSKQINVEQLASTAATLTINTGTDWIAEVLSIPGIDKNKVLLNAVSLSRKEMIAVGYSDDWDLERSPSNIAGNEKLLKAILPHLKPGFEFAKASKIAESKGAFLISNEFKRVGENMVFETGHQAALAGPAALAKFEQQHLKAA